MDELVETNGVAEAIQRGEASSTQMQEASRLIQIVS